MITMTSPKKSLREWPMGAVTSVLVSILCISGAVAGEMDGGDNLADLSLDELLNTDAELRWNF